MTIHHSPHELLTIGSSGLRGQWAWTPRSPGVVIIPQPSSRMGRGGVACINVLRERSRSWLRMALLARGERASHTDQSKLGGRVMQGINWLCMQPHTARSKIGLFGEGHGVAVAMWVATQHPTMVDAMVLSGGCIDSTLSELTSVQAATLLVAAELDSRVLANNRKVLAQLHCRCRLEVVPNAPRNLAHPEALETAAHLAAGWFESHLRGERRS